ncbi:class E sortase [Streptomyces sp. DH12]|uniref:class E sortase n=1 Tax=Streptomyces sp. DH12 TaxID=2857010 RepID=UPI001E4BC7BB|nr:class E sortase [Streptomyces sp. DH12]
MTSGRPGHAAGGEQQGSPWFRAAHAPGQEPGPGPAGRPEQPEQWPQEPYAAPAGPPAPVADPVTAPGPYEARYEAPYPTPHEVPQEAPYEPYDGLQAPQVRHGRHARPQPATQPPEPAYGEQPVYARPAPHGDPVPAGGPAPHGDPAAYRRQPRPYDRAAEPPGVEATAVLAAVTDDPARPDPHAPADPGAPSAADAPRPGGRAERRRAAKSRGRRRASASPAPTAAPASAPPMSRVEARRAARAAKEGFGVIASRVMGEVFITFGVLMLLFVAYQLWWTNVQAGLEVDRAKDRIAQDWAKGGTGEPGVFEAGEGFAILHIPKLDVAVPVAEGIDKEKVLDKGMAGHYADGALKTAMPSDKQGNFAVAGHRNTHGEPFRYINRLRPGDPIVVETRDAYYIYEMASILPQTPPSNVSVLKPVPDGSGFTGPGRYLTLTTCTPEFTSTYRMIVWGKMVEERPRSKGVPDALAG